MSNVIKSFGIAALLVAAFATPALASADTPWWCGSSFGSWWGLSSCSASTGPAGVLVYVQAPSYYYGGPTHQPSDFSVSVSGQSPSPAIFQGSINGTPVVLGAGSYSVSITGDFLGYTPSYSSGCSGTIATGEHALCVITMTRSSYNFPAPYPYVCTPGPYGCTYPLQMLSCTPSYQTVAAGSAAVFTAVGGSGVYNWTTPDRTYLGVGPKLSVVLQSYGTQTVIVNSGSQSATCTVNITAGPVYPVISGVTPFVTTPPVGGGVAVVTAAPVITSSYIAPALPNTGFAPLDSASVALAVVFLLGATGVVLPYARKAFATVLG